MRYGGIIGEKISTYSGVWDLRRQELEQLSSNWAILIFTPEIAGTPTESADDASSFSLPSGLQQNDIVFVAGLSDSNTLSSVPSGWSSGGTITTGSVDTILLYKVMGATPDTTISGLTTPSNGGYYAFAVRNLDTSNIFSASTNTISTTGATATPRTITTTTDNAMVVVIAAFDNQITTISTPTGYTTIATGSFGPGSLSAASYMAAYKIVASPSTESPSTLSVSPSGNEDWSIYTVALRAAGS
jgi:hypothetical protein